MPPKIQQKDAFGSDEIRRIWDKIDTELGGVQNLSSSDLRTFVLAVFQHKTFCRFSDVKQLKLKDILFNVDYFKVHIKYSKTDQGGLGQNVYLTCNTSHSRNAHMLMCLFLQKIHSDPTDQVYLFPPLKWSTSLSEYVAVPGRALAYNTAYGEFKKMLLFAGLDPSKFALHSPRIGGASEAFASGVAPHIIDRQGRWKSENTKFTYLRVKEKDHVSAISNASKF